MDDLKLNEVAETKMTEVPSVPEFKETAENNDKPVSSLETKENSITHLITRNEGLEGDKHPITGVPFERKEIELKNGEIVEGVFPEFDSVFSAEIPESIYKETDYKQFKECNSQLMDAMENNPDLENKFSKEQIEQIKDGIDDGTAPDGYVWHHSPESGVMELVDFENHAFTGHTGGRSIWGGGNEYR